MNFFKKNIEEENRKRLRNILVKVKNQSCPDDWEFEQFAVGGLTEVGFSKKKSNLYKKLDGYRKVDSVEIVRYKDKEPIGNPRRIPKKEFPKYILHSDNLPTLKTESAIIDVISPTIKRGNFKWKGFYNNEIISFSMNDLQFKSQVLNGSINFSNKFSIEVDMT